MKGGWIVAGGGVEDEAAGHGYLIPHKGIDAGAVAGEVGGGGVDALEAAIGGCPFGSFSSLGRGSCGDHGNGS